MADRTRKKKSKLKISHTMKKSISILIIAFMAGAVSSFAQGGFQMPSPEERTKRAHFKIDSAFKLDATKMAQADSAFLTFYKAADKVREEVFSGGGQPDFQLMQEKMKPHQEALDAKIKPVLGDDNFKIWKEQIEPTLRRRGGPPRQ